MIPVHFDQVNVIYKAPRDWDAKTHGPCADLPVLRTEDTATSRWRPSIAEIQALIDGGSIELTIHGGQPAVSLGVV